MKALSTIQEAAWQNQALPRNLSLNPDASPMALTRRPLGAG